MEREMVYRTARDLKRKNPVDATLPVIVVLLLQCGLLTLFSATFYKAVCTTGDSLLEVKKQLIGIGLGAVLMYITSRIPYHFWQEPKVVIIGLFAKIITRILFRPRTQIFVVFVNAFIRWQCKCRRSH